MNKIHYLIVFLFACLAYSACKSRSTQQKDLTDKVNTTFFKTGSVERFSPRLDDIIQPGELPWIIAEGFEWTEGPVWLPDQQILLFSDIPQNSVFQWSENDGMKLYLKPAGYTDTISRGGETGSNSLLLNKEGQLVLCQHGDRRIALMNALLDMPQPDFITIVDKWKGKRFNSPNDAVYNSRGDLFFTDPAYGMEFGFEDPKREMSFAGVFRYSSAGALTLLSDKMTAPNGIGLSPDEKTLYVANSGTGDEACWMEYKFRKDGSLDEGKIFYRPSRDDLLEIGSPDGLKVRGDGIIFATGPGGVWIFSPEGEHLGTIKTGQATSNCALDDDNKYLYITADMYLMRIRLK
jgi:gluconolactonase